MKIRRQITGVLGSSLTSYTSRNTDYDGYWLFGLLLRETGTLSVDLLDPQKNESKSDIQKAACRFAYERFKDQIQKSHIPAEYVASARLHLAKQDYPKLGPVNHRWTMGFDVLVAAEAISDLGRIYRAQTYIFVAPHDPAIEQRSTRRNENHGA